MVTQVTKNKKRDYYLCLRLIKNLKMNKLIFTIAFAFTLSAYAQISYADLEDQTGGITQGYGRWGAHQVVEENLEIAGKGTIVFYHPKITATKKATIFFVSGWGQTATTYKKFFHFMASQGYVVVSVSALNPGNIKQSYQNILDMIFKAQNQYPEWIDTSKIGLMGHSYGAGATIWLGKSLFSDATNWGSEGRFIFMSAPWYSLLVTEDDLRNYPKNVKLLVEVSNDDERHDKPETWNTDERAIRAVFELINIPNDEKDFIRVYSTDKTFEYNNVKYSYDANHYVSYTGVHNSNVEYQTYDALDVFAINRISHALIDYVFEGNSEGKKVALGNGDDEQVNMGFLTKLGVTDTPIITRPENEFVYKCTSNWNDFKDRKNTWLLQKGCADSNEDGIIDLLGKLSIAKVNNYTFSVYPVPATEELKIRFTDNSERVKSLEIIDITGKVLYKKTSLNSHVINISKLTSGLYYLKIKTQTSSAVRPFLVK